MASRTSNRRHRILLPFVLASVVMLNVAHAVRAPGVRPRIGCARFCEAPPITSALWRLAVGALASLDQIRRVQSSMIAHWLP